MVLRSIAERLIFYQTQVRDEFRATVSAIDEADIDYAPVKGMRTYRGMIQEIAATQVEALTFFKEGRFPGFEECESFVTGETLVDLMACADRVNGELLETIRGAGDEVLATPVEVPEKAEPWFGSRLVAPEEIVHWLTRHEYYHLGQIISYRWLQGHNPYSK